MFSLILSKIKENILPGSWDRSKDRSEDRSNNLSFHHIDMWTHQDQLKQQNTTSSSVQLRMVQSVAVQNSH